MFCGVSYMYLQSLSLCKVEEGALDAVIFLGMMVGGYVWGSLSDVVGRRSCLITSLTFNGVFGVASGLSPDYPSFLVLRFFSGIGLAVTMVTGSTLLIATAFNPVARFLDS